MAAVEEVVTRREKKSPKIGVDSDRISHLPSDVTQRILGFLPLIDVLRTTALSTNWRYKWTLLPRLILDFSFFNDVGDWIKSSDDVHSTDTSHAEMLKFLNIVNSILFRHVGPIHKFVLQIHSVIIEDIDISHWIQFLSGKSVKDLALHHPLTWHRDSPGHVRRKVPSCMFSCVGFNNLTHLLIVNFSLLSLPSTFRGFPCLISLKLTNMAASTSEVNKLGILVSKCPMLETLSLTIYGGESCLSIHAPKLQNLILDGCLSSICLEETKQIKTLSFEVFCNRRRDIVMELFTCLTQVEDLLLGSSFWPENWLIEVGCPRNFKFPIELKQLKHLELYGVPLQCQGAIAFILGLFQAAPNLQKLQIVVVDTGQLLLDNLIVEDCCLYNLKSAKLFLGLCSVRITLQLIKLILSSSPVLEVMSIESNQRKVPAKENLNIAKELLQYRRASANAEIIFKI